VLAAKVRGKEEEQGGQVVVDFFFLSGLPSFTQKTQLGSVTRVDRKDVINYITGEAVDRTKLDANLFC
jgi:hypothetical protein